MREVNLAGDTGKTMGDSGEAFALPSAVRGAAVRICSRTRTMNQIEAAVNALFTSGPGCRSDIY